MLRITLLYLLASYSLFAQSITDQVSPDSDFQFEAPGLTTEKIEKVSPTGRVLILTNSNNSFGKGDFISLLLNSNLAIRCIVAKVNNGSAGLKITRFYNPELFKSFRPGLNVQVIRGDDSYFGKTKQSIDDTEGKTSSMIKDEEDLYNEAGVIEDNLKFEDNNNRAIKTDNIITAFLGFIGSEDLDGESQSQKIFNAAWMYQIEDNIWTEVSYGEANVNDYPNEGLDTKITNLTLKVKYTFAAPFYSYIQPYAGYQIINADSPGAGVESENPDTTVGETVLAAEQIAVDSIKQSKIIFGLTVLKRLVPGWFIRADLGTDILSLGFGLEF